MKPVIPKIIEWEGRLWVKLELEVGGGISYQLVWVLSEE